MIIIIKISEVRGKFSRFVDIGLRFRVGFLVQMIVGPLDFNLIEALGSNWEKT